MTLTANPNPDHVQYPRGVKCVDCLEFAPAELERCVFCGSSAVALIEQGEWEDGKPEPAYPYHVEIDLSTGMVGYSRLTEAELEERARAAAVYLKEQARVDREAAERLLQLRERAAKDPDFAALLLHLGIRRA